MRINMTNVGKGNQEITMVNVGPTKALCMRSMQHALGDVCVDSARRRERESLAA